MTDDEMPGAAGVRLFAVPINDGFALEAAATLKGYRERAEKCLSMVETPPSGSPFADEVRGTSSAADPVQSARGSLRGMLLEVAFMSWSTALDHVRALEHDIVRKPAPVWSPLVIARAVLESCLVFDYLLEPSVSGALRLARGAGLWRKDTEHSRNLAKILEREEEAAGLDVYVTQALGECNVTARRSANGRITGYEVDGEFAPLDYNITERARGRLPDWIPMPYGLLSGAAHGRPWMTDRARALGEEGNLVGEAATVMAALQVVMAALEMGLKDWQGYFKLDLDLELAELDQYREATFLRLVGFAHADQ